MDRQGGPSALAGMPQKESGCVVLGVGVSAPDVEPGKASSRALPGVRGGTPEVVPLGEDAAGRSGEGAEGPVGPGGDGALAAMATSATAGANMLTKNGYVQMLPPGM